MVLIGGGSGLYVLGTQQFASFRRMSGLTSDRLITGGIFRWSRNPQHTGWGLLLLGVAVWRRSAVAVGLTALYGIAVHTYLTGMEEPQLVQAFGSAYHHYQRCTARYLGWPHCRSDG